MADRREEMAERLRNARKKAGYDSVAAASEAFGIKIPTLTSHENGTREFDVQAAQRYARAFKVSPAWLLALDNEPAPTQWINAKTLEPILASCLKLAPPGGWKESDAQLLAQSVEYGLQLLTTGPATQSSADALAVAGHAASLRLRDLRSAT
jgi:transcriptional regulator with XRE-family HTH domain